MKQVTCWQLTDGRIMGDYEKAVEAQQHLDMKSNLRNICEEYLWGAPDCELKNIRYWIYKSLESNAEE